MAMGPMGHGPYMGKVWVYAGCNDSQWVFEFAQNGGGPPCKLFITVNIPFIAGVYWLINPVNYRDYHKLITMVYYIINRDTTIINYRDIISLLVYNYRDDHKP